MKRVIWVLLVVVIVAWVMGTFALSTGSRCATSTILVVNHSGQAIPELSILNNDIQVWKGGLPLLGARRVTVPVRVEGGMSVRARFEDGQVSESEGGPYVTSLSDPAIAMFVIDDDRVEYIRIWGSVTFNIDPQSTTYLILSLSSLIPRYLGCPIRVLLDTM